MSHVPLITARKSRVVTKDVLNTLVLNVNRFAWFTTRDKKHTKQQDTLDCILYISKNEFHLPTAIHVKLLSNFWYPQLFQDVIFLMIIQPKTNIGCWGFLKLLF